NIRPAPVVSNTVGTDMVHALDAGRVYLIATSNEQPAAAADVRAMAAGDHDAFARVYAAYARMVRAILLGRVPRPEVDDLLQDVFVAAYTRIHELRDAAAFGGWIAAIARNRATDHLRQARPLAELPPDLPGGDPVEADTIIVLDAVRRLPEAYRETLVMRLVEGMSGQGIADR